MAVTALKVKNSVESLRDIVQDLLVPELKALKAQMTSMRNEMVTRFDAVRTKMRLRDEKQTQALTYLDAKQSAAIRCLDEKLTDSTKHISESIKQISDKFDTAVEFRERLATLEARMPRD